MGEFEIFESFMKKYGKKYEYFLIHLFLITPISRKIHNVQDLDFLVILPDFDPCSENCTKVIKKMRQKSG